MQHLSLLFQFVLFSALNLTLWPSGKTHPDALRLKQPATWQVVLSSLQGFVIQAFAVFFPEELLKEQRKCAVDKLKGSVIHWLADGGSKHTN